MSKQDDFLKQVETILNNSIGTIIASSVLKNNLSKLNKSPSSMTKEDGKIFVENIVKAVSLFETHNESKVIRTELEKLLNMLN
jgi:hypothetical protein